MRVALMATCVNDAMFPETPKAVVRLLGRLGAEFDFPEAQKCCGLERVKGVHGSRTPIVVLVDGDGRSTPAPAGDRDET